MELAEPNYLIKRAEVVPNDRRFAEQWALRSTGQSGGTPGTDIGVDFTHPDLAGNRWTNPAELPGNNRDDDRDGFVDDLHDWDFVADSGAVRDEHGHGTSVAGLMSLRVLDAGGVGDVAAAVEAIDYAAAHGARVVNCSCGTEAESLMLRDAIERAGRRGVVVVASAGKVSSGGVLDAAGALAALNGNPGAGGQGPGAPYVPAPLRPDPEGLRANGVEGRRAPPPAPRRGRPAANLPDRTLVFDATNAVVSKVAYQYDLGGEFCQSRGDVIQHDPAYNTSYHWRGNLWSVARFDPSHLGDWGRVTETRTGYDTNGSAVFAYDAEGHITHFDYADNFSVAGPARPVTHAYVTTVVDPESPGDVKDESEGD